MRRLTRAITRLLNALTGRLFPMRARPDMHAHQAADAQLHPQHTRTQ